MIEPSFWDLFWDWMNELVFSWRGPTLFCASVLIFIVGLVHLRKTSRTRPYLVRRRVLRAITIVTGTVITLGIALILYVVYSLAHFKSGP